MCSSVFFMVVFEGSRFIISTSGSINILILDIQISGDMSRVSILFPVKSIFCNFSGCERSISLNYILQIFYFFER